jgi:hypothetical protein
MKKNNLPHTGKSRRTSPAPTKTTYTILAQLVQWIPHGLIPKLAADFELDIRKFSATSHVVALMFGQLARCPCLNGIVDAAAAHRAEWTRIRGAQPPARNTFSNANKTRDPAMAETLYWAVFKHFADHFPDFTGHRSYTGFLFRVRKAVHAIDSTTLRLALNAIDRARHRRKKAAAKLHLRLDLSNTLPAFAVVEPAAHHDVTRAKTLCAGLKDGDVLLADRAYTDFAFLDDLHRRGVRFVVRDKTSLCLKNVKKSKREDAWKGAEILITADDAVRLKHAKTHASYPRDFRRVTARVLVDQRWVEMRFLTNAEDWSARTIAELYKARWGIELFFKELKQTCEIGDFVGHNENAVKWQVWTALLTHLLLRQIGRAHV